MSATNAEIAALRSQVAALRAEMGLPVVESAAEELLRRMGRNGLIAPQLLSGDRGNSVLGSGKKGVSREAAELFAHGQQAGGAIAYGALRSMGPAHDLNRIAGELEHFGIVERGPVGTGDGFRISPGFEKCWLAHAGWNFWTR